MIYISDHDFALCLLLSSGLHMTTQKWPNYLYCTLSLTVNIWLFPLPVLVFFHKILMGSDLAKKIFNSYY